MGLLFDGKAETGSFSSMTLGCDFDTLLMIACIGPVTLVFWSHFEFPPKAVFETNPNMGVPVCREGTQQTKVDFRAGMSHLSNAKWMLSTIESQWPFRNANPRREGTLRQIPANLSWGKGGMSLWKFDKCRISAVTTDGKR